MDDINQFCYISRFMTKPAINPPIHAWAAINVLVQVALPFYTSHIRPFTTQRPFIF